LCLAEDITTVLKRVDQLMDKAKESEKQLRILEQKRKKDEEALKEIRRRYNLI